MRVRPQKMAKMTYLTLGKGFSKLLCIQGLNMVILAIFEDGWSKLSSTNFFKEFSDTLWVESVFKSMRAIN